MAGIGRVVGKPQRDTTLIAEHDMNVLGLRALRVGQEIGIERQLQDVFGIG